jgi:hypothetical protein
VALAMRELELLYDFKNPLISFFHRLLCKAAGVLYFHRRSAHR